MKNPRVNRRKEILKIRAEINAKETKETIANINKGKSWFFERRNKIAGGTPQPRAPGQWLWASPAFSCRLTSNFRVSADASVVATETINE